MSDWSSATRPGLPSAARRPFSARIAAHYLTDLIVSIFLVLSLGWLVQASVDDVYLRDALVAQNQVYAEISRFTPRNLFFSYASTVDRITRGIVFGYSAGDDITDVLAQAGGTIVRFAVGVVVAVPRTLIGLYNETSSGAAWVVLAGFGMAIGTVFTCVLAARTSVARLALAAALSPIAISVVFLVLQGFMVLMLDAFYWFTALAPYAVACPVLCTLYWVIFPNADRGATAMVARAAMQALERPR